VETECLSYLHKDTLCSFCAMGHCVLTHPAMIPPFNLVWSAYKNPQHVIPTTPLKAFSPRAIASCGSAAAGVDTCKSSPSMSSSPAGQTNTNTNNSVLHVSTSRSLGHIQQRLVQAVAYCLVDSSSRQPNAARYHSVQLLGAQSFCPSTHLHRQQASPRTVNGMAGSTLCRRDVQHGLIIVRACSIGESGSNLWVCLVLLRAV
jgi:hypothetical protein